MLTLTWHKLAGDQLNIRVITLNENTGPFHGPRVFAFKRWRNDRAVVPEVPPSEAYTIPLVLFTIHCIFVSNRNILGCRKKHNLLMKLSY